VKTTANLLAAVLLGLVACAVLACGQPAASRTVSLAVINESDIEVVVTLNGSLLGRYPAHTTTTDIVIDGLMPKPWSIEARSPSGTLLTNAQVTGDLIVAGTDQMTVRTDTPCGTVALWYGGPDAKGPVLEKPAVPGTGACD
jgi:hypothetical protein